MAVNYIVFEVRRWRFCLILLLSCFSTGASAAPETIKVYTHYSLPSESMAEGSLATFHHKMVNAILEEAGLRYKLFQRPFARGSSVVQRTPNTLLYAVIRTPYRENSYRWVGSLSPAESDYYLFKLASRSDINISVLDDARSYRIGVLQADKFRQYFEGLGFQNLDPVNSSTQNFNKLIRGRIDLLAEDSRVILNRCGRLKYDCRQFDTVIKLAGVSSGAHLAVNKNSDPELIADLGRAYHAKVEDGSLERLFEPLRKRLAERATAFPWPLCSLLFSSVLFCSLLHMLSSNIQLPLDGCTADPCEPSLLNSNRRISSGTR